MADLSRLIVAGKQAANACDAAPLLVRPYLKPLRDFVDEVAATLQGLDDDLMLLQLNEKKREIERANQARLTQALFENSVFENTMGSLGVSPYLLTQIKNAINAQADGGTAVGDQQKEP